MIVAVASGKGGTGKTLVATSLARTLARRGRQVAYVDTDVEEPNGALLLRPSIDEERRATVSVPRPREPRCDGNAACQRACAFNAILAAKGTVIVFDELCHSCGACLRACPTSALVEEEREIGTVRFGTASLAPGDGEAPIRFVEGRLDVGEARGTPLAEAVREIVKGAAETVIIDSPPGTSCLAMAAVRGVDLVLLVAEPTPFGLHDLELAVKMCRALGVPVKAVINRADLGDDRVRRFLAEERISVPVEIGYSVELARAYADARPLLEADARFAAALEKLADEVGGAA